MRRAASPGSEERLFTVLQLVEMNPPMIDSSNSVSTTRRKREAERSVNWTVEETQVLLCAWSDERVQKSLAENLRNRHVFKHLSARMSEMGFARSPHQCRLRVKTLKANYVRAKLQRSVSSPQQCTFKYFAEMDAVLGRRSARGEAGPLFSSSEQTADGIDRTGSIPQDFTSEIGGHHFGPLRRTERPRSCSLEARAAPQLWPLDSEVKLEEREDSTDEFEFVDAGFSQCPRDRSHQAYLDSAVHQEICGSPVEASFSTPSPHIVHPPPSPPPPPPFPPRPPLQSTGSPLPASPDPDTPPASGRHHLASPTLDPVLKHLVTGFQQLVSDTRGLLVQLERERQEQARWHQELLTQWLEREERRQREAAEREERREKARMEHEIRVLELLTSLGREHGCRCSGSQAAPEAAAGPSPSSDKHRN